MPNNIPFAPPINPTLKETPIDVMANSIKLKASINNDYNNFASQTGDSLFASAGDNKLKAKVQDIRVKDAFAPLSSGEYTPKFESYDPLINNEDYLAKNQSTSDKWENGITKALTKLETAIIGGTAGLVYGVGSALDNGNFSKLYDNEFSNKLADLNTKLSYQLPNWYTKQEKEKDLFGQAGTANFWADKFLGGLSFTAGALISEGIWAYATGGTSLATIGARYATKVGSIFRASKWGVEAAGEVSTIASMAKFTRTLKELDPTLAVGITAKQTAINVAKAGDLITTVGFMARSSGYEASVEALQYKKEAEENFYNNFAQLNGREPNQSDIAKFQKDIESGANTVFGVTMAILMPSNFVTMGHILDMKSPIKTGLSEFLDKKAFGYGIGKVVGEGGTTTYKALEATTGQKVARNVFDYIVKPGVTEGLFEEGLQGVTTKYGNRWINHSYDPKQTQQTFDSMGAFYDSMAEQYGTKAGWIDVGLGVLIGVVGGSINARSEQNQKSEELAYKSSVATQFQAEGKTLQSLLLPNRIQTANRIAGFSSDAKEEAQKGNIAMSALAQKSAILTYINAKQTVGESIDDTTEEVKKSLDLITPEQWKESGIEADKVDSHKEETLQEFKDLSKQWKTNKSYWQYMIGQKLVGEQNLKTTALEEGVGADFSTNAQIVEALAWKSTIGEGAHKQMKDAQEVFVNELGQEYATTLNTVTSLKKQSSVKQGQVTKTTKQYKLLSAEREKLVKLIAKENSKPSNKEGLKPVEGMTSRLLELDTKINDLSVQLDTYAEELNKAENYSKEIGGLKVFQDLSGSTISGQDLIALEDNIEKFKNVIDSFHETNPQRATYLKDLLKEYSDSEQVFMQSKATQRAILDPKFKMENISSWLGSKIKGKKEMNANTQMWLQESLDSYSKYKQQGMASIAENITSISNEEYNDFVDNGVVSEQVLNDIATKIKNSESLSDREQAILADKTTEIEEIIKKINQEVVVKQPTVVIDNRTPIQKEKQKIEGILKNFGLAEYFGDNYDGIANKQPTQEEIDEFQQLRKDKKYSTVRYKELQQKLQDWKILSSATDAENSSIAEIIAIIDQLNTEVEAEDTKTEITEDDVNAIVESTELKKSNQVTDYGWAMNTLGSVTVVRPQGLNVLRFSHLKMNTLVERLGGVENATLNGKPTTFQELEDLEPNDKVSIDGATFVYLNGGVIEVKLDDFNTRQQALNMYVSNANSVTWSYKNVNQVKDDEWVKMDSDFVEDIDPQEIYNLNEGDKLSLEIKEDGGNQQLLDKYNRAKTDKTKAETKKKLMSQLKIFLVTSQGIKVSTLKALRQGTVDEDFLRLREEAFKRYMESANKDSVKLGIEVTVEKVFLGSPELTMQDNQTVNIPITERGATQVVATGYIEGDNVVLNKEIKDLNKTFVGKIARNSGGRKVPVIVIKKGVHNVLYPITLVKTISSQAGIFDDILAQQISPQDKVLKINDEIQKQRIQVDKLVYADINDQEKLDKTREAFDKKEVFVNATTLASPQYKTNSLVTDAKINIDLENFRAISDSKVRIKLDDVKYTPGKEVKIDSQIELEKSLSDLAEEVYNDFIKNSQTKYVNAKGEILEDTKYTDTFDNSPIIKAKNNLDQKRNINILKEAFSEKLPKIVVNALGEERINTIKKLLEQYDFVKQQIVVKESDKKSGEDNSDCKEA